MTTKPKPRNTDDLSAVMSNIQGILFELAKTHLNITWDLSSEEINRLTYSAMQGMAYLESRANMAVDWMDIANLNLLVNWVRYDFNQALEYFDVNFHDQLVTFILTNNGKYVEVGDEDA